MAGSLLPRLTAAVALSGLALHAYIALFESSGNDVWSVVFLAWGGLPYLICLVIACLGRRALHGLFAALACLGLDAVNYYQVFVDPQSSTAALGLLFVPLLNLVVSIPLGVTVAALIGWIARKKGGSVPKR